MFLLQETLCALSIGTICLYHIGYNLYLYIPFTRYLKLYNIITSIRRKHWAAPGLSETETKSFCCYAVVDETWWWSLSSFSTATCMYVVYCQNLPESVSILLCSTFIISGSILVSSFSILPSGITSTSNGGTKAKTLFDHLFFYFHLYFLKRCYYY